MTTNVKLKPATKASETWLNVITAAGAVLTGATSSFDGAAPWVALALCVALAAVHAFFRTPLSSSDGKPGVKTQAFWSAVIVVVASVATAVAEADIAGLPKQVTQVAAMVSSALVAAGYNVWRYKKKVRRPS